MLKYNNPKILIFTGVLGSFVNGTMQPIMGVFLSKILGWMTAPSEYFIFLGPGFDGTPIENMVYHVNIFALAIFILAIGQLIFKIL